MSFNTTQELLVFINQALYCSTHLPLLLEVIRLKTTRGISDGSLWLGFTGLILGIFYNACLGLPLFYHVSLTVQLIFTVTMLICRYKYGARSRPANYLLGVGFLGDVILGLALIPLALIWPFYVGTIVGWIGVGVNLIGRIPQIVKIQKDRSVYGFAYKYVLLTGIAGIMELGIVLYYRLPLQTMTTASAGIVAFIIFTLQFYFFSWRLNKIKNR